MIVLIYCHYIIGIRRFYRGLEEKGNKKYLILNMVPYIFVHRNCNILKPAFIIDFRVLLI